MTHLSGQTHHWRHDPTGQNPAEKNCQRQGQDKSYQHHGKQHPLTLFEITLVLQQHIAPTVDYFDHRVIRQVFAEYFVKARIQMSQISWQCEIATAITEVEQLVRLRPMAPIANAV